MLTLSTLQMPLGAGSGVLVGVTLGLVGGGRLAALSVMMIVLAGLILLVAAHTLARSLGLVA
jgi:hypothetical protein